MVRLLVKYFYNNLINDDFSQEVISAVLGLIALNKMPDKAAIEVLVFFKWELEFGRQK